MEEELLERKILQRKRIRGLLIALNLAFFVILILDVIKIISNWW